MIRIEVEVETNDPALRDYVLGDVESWRRTPAKVSVSTRDEDAWSGGAKTVHFSSSTSLTVGVVAEAVEEEEPAPPRRVSPPQRMTVEAARRTAGFPVFVAPTLVRDSMSEARMEPGGDEIPQSVVVTHPVMDDRGRHRGNVWITSSSELLASSRFDAWRTIQDHDVSEDRSGGYYRCKVRTQLAESGYVLLESTAHHTLDEVFDLVGTLRAD